MNDKSNDTSVLSEIIGKLDDVRAMTTYVSILDPVSQMMNTAIVALTLGSSVKQVRDAINDMLCNMIEFCDNFQLDTHIEPLCDVWQLLNPDCQFHMCLDSAANRDDNAPSDLTDIPY